MKYNLGDRVSFLCPEKDTKNWQMLMSGDIVGTIPHRPAYNVADYQGKIYTVNEADIIDDVVAFMLKKSL